MSDINRDGTANRSESVPFPDLEIVDAHFHLGNIMGVNYFAPDYLTDAHDGHKVVSSIYVECDMGYSDDPDPAMRPIGEARHALAQARRTDPKEHALVAGFIGKADLTVGSRIRDLFDAFKEQSKGRFRGVRSRIAWDEDPEAGYHGRSDFPSKNILVDPRFLESAKVLEGMGLILETWGFHPQIPDLRRIAARCPNLTIVLNHMGGPLGVGRYARTYNMALQDWRNNMMSIAELPNVYVKLSGIGVTRLGLRYSADVGLRDSGHIAAIARPYLMTCLEIFGPARCIFGSNFPVDRVVAPYRTLLTAYKKALGDLSTDERSAVFASNAARVYAL